jgi:hypothetical protein
MDYKNNMSTDRENGRGNKRVPHHDDVADFHTSPFKFKISAVR